MPGIRLLEASDIEQVASLWQKCFRKSTARPSPALQKYFFDVFLDGPWYRPEYRPLVNIAADGAITGFLGRMHRTMQFRGRVINCAVASQLMVDPDRAQPFCAFHLLRAFHAGPHDLAYSDGATTVAWRLWERCGGQACHMLSMEWSRPLRPAQAFFERFCQSEHVGSIARVLQPCSGFFDAVAVRTMPRIYHKPRRRTHWSPATAADLLPLMRRASVQVALSPHYTDETLTWLLARLAESRSFGKLRAQVVHDAGGEPVGWFIYYARRGRRAYVLQVGALPTEGSRVISCLFRDAWEQDCSALVGQFDPQLLGDLSVNHCRFHCDGVGVLMQSPDPEITLALHRGDALVSRLDGEWWMRFGIDRQTDW
jgi:hypothetical protein